jgi:cytochrome c-type biogenesis protein CcmF
VGVGRPFFDRMALPISFALLIAMSIGPVTPYRKANPRIVWERIRTPLRISLAVSAISVFLWRPVGWLLLTVLLSTFVVTTVGRQLWDQGRRAAAKRSTSVASEMLAATRKDTAFWGGQIAHIGIAVLALGIALSANQSITGTVELEPGRPVEFAGFELTMVDDFTRSEPQRIVTGARVEVRRGGDVITVLEPRLNQYVIRVADRVEPRQQVATPAVDTGIRGDLYLSLGSDPSRTPVELEVYWFPFIWVVWVGGFLAGAGGLWAWLVRPPRRKQQPDREEAARV